MRFVLVLLTLLAASAASGQPARFAWPAGAQAAVALTYDDGIDVHLDNAMPDLEAVRLRGTFYVPANSESLLKRMSQWREAARKGHEIGNHTLVHPCLREADGRARPFVVPERDLGVYTVRRIADEIRITNTLLFAVDGLSRRTMAYSCGDETAGGVSYVDAIKPIVAGARAYKHAFKALADPRTVDLYRVPSWAVLENSAADMIAWAEEAARRGQLAVFTFHGVGGGHGLNVARDDHRKLLAWLDQNRNRVWTAPFLQIVDHIGKTRRP
jgi:peptidoglycan/xylan/chitin deacetylase (PgdA/CDA1 family)